MGMSFIITFLRKYNQMEQGINTISHFPIMILASLLFFFIIIRIVIGKQEFADKKRSIFLLSIIVIIVGMLFGKYGANWGLEWWIYYPVPMLINVLLPPLILKMNIKKSILYLSLSFISAPLIHVFFSFFLGWTEYMPFWNIL